MMRYRTRMPGRVWLKTEGMEYDLSLKVMSYNILAPCYSYFSLFSHVDKPQIQWHNRLPLIIQEIEDVGMPELISFQEYQKDKVHGLQQFLVQKGYEYYTGFKTYKQDGLAIFYQSDRFQTIYQGYLNLNLNSHCSSFYSYDFNTCCIFLLLKVNNKTNDESSAGNEDKKDDGLYILVVNTHLIYNPMQGSQKMAQLVLIQKTIQKIKEQYDFEIQVIFNGDFNFLPNSALYQYMTKGFIKYQFIQESQFSGQHDNKLNHTISNKLHFQQSTQLANFIINNTRIQYPLIDQLILRDIVLDTDIRLSQNNVDSSSVSIIDGVLQSSLKFRSSYAEFYRNYYQKQMAKKQSQSLVDRYISDKDIEKYSFEFSQTQLAQSFKATVDYIWLESERISVDSIYQVVDYNDKHFPNQQYGSDHMSLVTTLGFNTTH